MLCRDPDCQYNAFEGFATALAPHTPVAVAGLYWYGWSADPTAGGPSDMSYTPYGKAAENIVRAVASRGLLGSATNFTSGEHLLGSREVIDNPCQADLPGKPRCIAATVRD